MKGEGQQTEHVDCEAPLALSGAPGGMKSGREEIVLVRGGKRGICCHCG